MTILTAGEAERIFRKVGRSGECWEWMGTRQSSGYGQVWLRGAMRQAYRVMWEHFNGPVPSGLEMDHLCRNRGCVNPDHLEPVTHAENMRRRRSYAQLATHCGTGEHAWTPENTRINSSTGTRFCRACRNAYKRRRRAAGMGNNA